MTRLRTKENLIRNKTGEARNGRNISSVNWGQRQDCLCKETMVKHYHRIKNVHINLTNAAFLPSRQKVLYLLKDNASEKIKWVRRHLPRESHMRKLVDPHTCESYHGNVKTPPCHFTTRLPRTLAGEGYGYIIVRVKG